MEAKIAQLEQQLLTVTQQLQQQQAAAAPSAQPPGPTAGFRDRLIDTRTLGRPEQFQGEESKWSDWGVVARAYASLIVPHLTDLLVQAEGGVEEKEVLNAVLTQEKAAMSTQLYYVLLMLCRQEPRNIVINSGGGEGP